MFSWFYNQISLLQFRFCPDYFFHHCAETTTVFNRKQANEFNWTTFWWLRKHFFFLILQKQKNLVPFAKPIEETFSTALCNTNPSVCHAKLYYEKFSTNFHADFITHKLLKRILLYIGDKFFVKFSVDKKKIVLNPKRFWLNAFGRLA